MSRQYPEDEPNYRSWRGLLVGTMIVLLLVALLLVVGGLLSPVRASCGEHYAPNPPHEPTGVKNCVVYGEGTASRYPGPGVARNDCVWPWTDCTPITITAHATGKQITVTPTMYGDLYTGTPDERIVDLDPAAVAALGLNWDDGLYAVTVEPVRQHIPVMPAAESTLPDTASHDARQFAFVLLLVVGVGAVALAYYAYREKS